MSEAEGKRNKPIEDGSSCFDDSETSQFDQKAYDARIARQPLVLGPGSERFLDGKVPLSPLSRAAIKERGFEGAHLNLDSNSVPMGSPSSQPSPVNLQISPKADGSPKVSTKTKTLQKNSSTIVVVIGLNDWFHKHLVSKLISAGVFVHLFLVAPKISHADMSSKFYADLKLQTTKYLFSSHYLLKSDGSLYYDKLTKVLENASIVIDNVSVTLKSDEITYPLLSFLANYTQRSTSIKRNVRLLVGLPHRASNQRYPSSTGLRSAVTLRNHVKSSIGIQEANVIFLSHGTLLGPLHPDSVPRPFTHMMKDYFESTGIPEVFSGCRFCCNLIKPFSPVDVRDASRAVLRIIENPAILDGHYHVSRPAISMLRLWGTFILSRSHSECSVLTDKLIAPFFSVLEHLANLINRVPDDAKFQLCVDNKTELRMKLNPLSKTLSATFTEYHSYTSYCTYLGTIGRSNVITDYVLHGWKAFWNRILQFLWFFRKA